VAAQSDNNHWFRQNDFSMEVSRDVDGSVKVALAGEFDPSAAADLRACLMRTDVLSAAHVHVDCGLVTFETSGIDLLLSECKRARSARAALPASYGDGVTHVLQVSGLIGVKVESLPVSQHSGGGDAA
jgi:anti-anti-sigma regulatory factor